MFSIKKLFSRIFTVFLVLAVAMIFMSKSALQQNAISENLTTAVTQDQNIDEAAQLASMCTTCKVDEVKSAAMNLLKGLNVPEAPNQAQWTHGQIVSVTNISDELKSVSSADAEVKRKNQQSALGTNNDENIEVNGLNYAEADLTRQRSSVQNVIEENNIEEIESTGVWVCMSPENYASVISNDEIEENFKNWPQEDESRGSPSNNDVNSTNLSLVKNFTNLTNIGIIGHMVV